MSKEPTLADALIRASYDKRYRSFANLSGFRQDLAAARKFVLDDDMSAFTADLAYASLPKRRSPRRDTELMEGFRTLARLPHRLTWIELNLKARFSRAVSAYGAQAPLGVDGCPDRSGWLLSQHPTVETAFRAVECVSHTVHEGELIPNAQPHLLAWTWTTDDAPLPWKSCVGGQLSEMLTGLQTYQSDKVGAVETGYFDSKVTRGISSQSLLEENASDVRYLWSLLATINQLPVSATEVRAHKGYVARGTYRKFVDHTIIRLCVPQRVSRARLAMKVTAQARRRRHDVRGHWRKNWRDPDGALLWVPEHQRGDASLGFVLHDYAVTHEVSK